MGEKVLGPSPTGGQMPSADVTHAIIAMPGASHADAQARARPLRRHQIARHDVPAIGDIVSGKVSVSALRPSSSTTCSAAIRCSSTKRPAHAFLDGKTVLVTGAGGSIGAELCRQIARFAPARLVLFEISEFALYAIEQEFRDRQPAVRNLRRVIGDVKDARRVAEVFARYRPEVVFHAAAYKHVPLMEEDNAWQAVRNNVLSTHRAWRAPRGSARASRSSCSSPTDKAVNPTNVMGATKRLAEMVCQVAAGADALRSS